MEKSNNKCKLKSTAMGGIPDPYGVNRIRTSVEDYIVTILF